MKPIRSSFEHKQNRIEIIPLIDIMFFLLASFMLVSLSLTQQASVNVNLPTATQARREGNPDLLQIAVNRRGEVLFQNRVVTLGELSELLRNRAATNGTATPVYISGDRDATHGAMVGVLDLARRAGFERVAFNVRVDSTR